MSETEDAKREAHWLEVQAELNPGETEIERTLTNLSTIKFGWHRVRTADGGFGYFPSVPVHSQGSAAAREAENEWEQRSIACHEKQRLDDLEWQRGQPVYASFAGNGVARDPDPFKPENRVRPLDDGEYPTFHERDPESTEFLGRKEKRLHDAQAKAGEQKIKKFHETAQSTEVKTKRGE